MNTAKVVIIDYRLGNLFSVRQACERVGLETIVSSDPRDIAEADGLLLPGVGAFGNAMENLRRLDLVSAIKDFAAAGGPLFGICLGMQLLFEESEEFGIHEGLGLLPGRIVKFPDQVINGRRLKVPSIGWGRLDFCQRESATNEYQRQIIDQEWMYFVHSFYAEPTLASDILTKTVYGQVNFCSSVLRGNVFGTQFHPEKSGEPGLRIYKIWSTSLSEKKVGVQ
ncbi:imidazole glycerol phosphate synthase subunit HisH [Planctomycetaceae bacterium SH139]